MLRTPHTTIAPASRARRVSATLVVAAAAAAALPSAALAHGGREIAQGQRDGVNVVVQGAELEEGEAGVHLSANVTGDAAPDPDDVRVRFVIRDGSDEVFSRRAGNDGTAIHDVDVPRGDRGPWEDWDVSALVTLEDGRTVRVTNAPDDPPVLEPAVDERDEAGTGGATGGTTTGSGAAPAAASAQPVDATTASDQGAPGWVLPSAVAIVVVALGGSALVLRRRTREED